MKIIFLIFVIEGVAVLAEKDINQKDKNAGSMSSDFSFILHLISTLEQRIRQFVMTAEKQFLQMKEKINDEKNRFEDSLNNKIKTVDLSFGTDQKKEYRQTLKNANDESENEKCLAKEEVDFRDRIENYAENALKCMKVATNEARFILERARDTFSKAFEETLNGIRKLADCVQSGDSDENNQCIQERMHDFRRKFYNMRAKGSVIIRVAADVLENQKEQMGKCYDNFFSHLKKMIIDLYILMWNCEKDINFRNQRQ